MEIGVISDTHGSLLAWKRAVEGPFAEVDMIVHAGDVLYHGPRNPLPSSYQAGELAEEINKCPVPIHIARGNCDSEVDEMVLDYPLQTPYALIHTEIGRILITHGHHFSTEDAKALAGKLRIDIWISGHTHLPLIEKISDTIFVNPGSPSLPKGDNPPTVAVISLERVILVDLRSGNTIKSYGR